MASNVIVTEQDRYTVAGLIRHLARQQADDEMLVQGAERRTWAEEFDVACRVAQAAKREGLGVGDRIAFLDRNGIAYFDFLFGGSLHRRGERRGQLATGTSGNGRHHR